MVVSLPQKSFISFSPTFRLGFSVVGIRNHFNGFPGALVWTVEKGSKSCVGRLNEKREMLLSRRPEKNIKMVPNSRWN